MEEFRPKVRVVPYTRHTLGMQSGDNQAQFWDRVLRLDRNANRWTASTSSGLISGQSLETLEAPDLGASRFRPETYRFRDELLRRDSHHALAVHAGPRSGQIVADS
jgi:hypothetical protein